MKRFSIKAAILAVSAVIIAVSSCGNSYRAHSADDVRKFLSERGVEVVGDCSEKTVTIPAEFGEVYERYNELQKQSGFDLSPFRSKEATVYTFTISAVNGQPSDLSEAHVMVCDNIVVGGDLASPALNGEMHPLP
ncbi:MAG: DUF4830 domain-containing protein [Clostridia bacterium]|nr:DUF4830 domain-containing protein [Clostridia bacterium]